MLVVRASPQPSMMMARMAMMNAHSMLFSLVCCCECVLYLIRQPPSTLRVKVVSVPLCLDCQFLTNPVSEDCPLTSRLID